MMKLAIFVAFLASCSGWSVRTVGTLRSTSTRLPMVMKDYPKPKQLENTDNFRDAAKLSARFADLKSGSTTKTVAIIGGNKPFHTSRLSILQPTRHALTVSFFYLQSRPII